MRNTAIREKIKVNGSLVETIRTAKMVCTCEKDNRLPQKIEWTRGIAQTMRERGWRMESGKIELNGE